MGAEWGKILTKEIHQCSSCGGFCKKSGCERENVKPPPPEWPLIKNIIAEYGLDAISFVAEWKAAQRPWVGLTEERIEAIWLKWKDNDDDWANVLGLARLFEAELKEKNA